VRNVGGGILLVDTLALCVQCCESVCSGFVGLSGEAEGVVRAGNTLLFYITDFLLRAEDVFLE
jgi:hypothetical protein